MPHVGEEVGLSYKEQEVVRKRRRSTTRAVENDDLARMKATTAKVPNPQEVLIEPLL